MLDGKEVTESWLQFKAANSCPGFEWIRIFLDISRYINIYYIERYKYKIVIHVTEKGQQAVAGDRRSQRMRDTDLVNTSAHSKMLTAFFKIEDIFQNLHEVMNKWGWKVFFTLPIPIHMASPKTSFLETLPGWTEAVVDF